MSNKATGSKINDQTLTTLTLLGGKHTNSSDLIGTLKVIGGGAFSENVLIQGNLYVGGSAFIPGTNATELQGQPINPSTPSANDILVYSGSDWRPENTLNLTGNLTVGGNLLVTGTTTNINSVTVTTVDNVILINSGELGAGVTSTYNTAATLPGAGLEIDRGSLTNYQIVFDETTDSLKIGLKDTPLSSVVTRTDPLTTNGVMYWDSNNITNDPSMTYSTSLFRVPVLIASDRVITSVISSTDYLILHSQNGVKIGGSDNVVSNTHAIVAGGNGNTASGQYSTVLGGRGNIASGNYSTVLGGNSDSAIGLYSLVAGLGNSATMNYTTALGNNANANTTGSFVYSDNSGRLTTPSDNNQFVVRASGGLLFFTGGNADTQGVKIRASDSTVLKMDNSFIDANARSINGYPISTDIPVLGQGLIFNGSIWTPSDISGGGSGDATSLRGYLISTDIPTLGQALIFNGTIWTPSDISGGGGSGNATSIQGRTITSDTYNANLNDILIFNGTSWGASDSVILKTGTFNSDLNSNTLVTGIISGTKGTFSSDLTSGILTATKGTFSSDLTSGVFSATKGTFSSDLTSGVFSATKGTFSSDLTSGVFSATKGTFASDLHAMNTTIVGTITVGKLGTFNTDLTVNGNFNGKKGTFSSDFTSGILTATKGTFSSDLNSNTLSTGVITGTKGTFTSDLNSNTLVTGILTGTKGTFTSDLTSGILSATKGTFSSDLSAVNTTINGSLTVSGLSIFNNTSYFPSGISISPSITFSSDTNTGFYNNSDTIGVITGGLSRVVIGTTNTTFDTGLTISGTGTFNSDLTVNGLFNGKKGTFTSDLISTSVTSAFNNVTSLLTVSGLSIFNNTCYFPSGISIVPSITFSSDTNTGFYNNSDTIGVITGGVSRVVIGTTNTTIDTGLTISGTGTFNSDLTVNGIFNGKKGTFASDLTTNSLATGIITATKGTFSSDLTSGILTATKGTFSSDLTSGILTATKGTFSSDLNSNTLITGILTATKGTFSSDLTSGVFSATKGTFSSDLTSGILTATKGTFSSDLNSNTLVTGILTGTKGTFSSDLTSGVFSATKGTFSSDLNSNTLVTGILTATKGTFSSDLNSNTLVTGILTGTKGTFSSDLTSGILTATKGTFSSDLNSNTLVTGILTGTKGTFSSDLTSGVFSATKGTFSSDLISGIHTATKGTFSSDLNSNTLVTGILTGTKGTFSSDLTSGVFSATKGTFSSDLTSGVFSATKGTFTSDLNILSLYPVNTDQTTMVANGETITTSRYLNTVDPGTAARTGVILSAGTANSQQLRIVNKGTFSITFATEATSNVSGGVAISINPLQTKDFSWRTANSRWIPTSGTVCAFANGSAGNLSATNSDQETTPIISNLALNFGTLAGLSARYLSPITAGTITVKTSINNSDRHIVSLNTTNQSSLTMSDIPFSPSDLISVRIDTSGLSPIGPQEHVCISVFQRV